MKNKFYLAAFICFFTIVFMAMFMIDEQINILRNVSDTEEYVDFDQNLNGNDLESIEVLTEDGNQLEVIQVKADENQQEVEEVKLQEVKFIWPTKGKIITAFSPNKFIHDEVLDQYRTANEIVMKLDKKQKIKAAEDGKVISMEDDLFGKHIEVKHTDGYTTTYRNVSNVVVENGEFVKMGESLGESTEVDEKGTYFVFGIKKNDRYVNPEKYID